MPGDTRRPPSSQGTEAPLRAQKIELSTLADHVWEQLYVAIIEGRLKGGDRLVELEIARQVGTSQGPVRDALQRLERDGLVERYSHSATFVTQLSREDMYEVFLIRNVLERITFRRTAHIITAEACDELQALIEKMVHAAERDDIISVLNFDMQFHTLICQWSGNHTLLSVWAPLRAQIQRFVVQHYHDYFSDIHELAVSHQPLVDALRANDVQRAEREIQTHVMRAWSDSGRDTAASSVHEER